MTYPAFRSPQPPLLPPLEHVFGKLAEVIDDLRSDGRSTHSAGVKPRLAERLGIMFDERSYGFATFRDFLTAAQRAGAIVMWPAASGPDVVLALPGRPPEDSAQHRASARIRPDFWATFMDWTPGFDRAYDREQGRAFSVPVTAEAYDPHIRQLRHDMQADHIRFVPIEPITMATQTDWARSFASSRSAGERDDLALALRADRPLQEFTRKIRTLPSFRDWTAFRNERVAEAISSWARQHKLTIDPLAPPLARADTVAPEHGGLAIGTPSRPLSAGRPIGRTTPRQPAPKHISLDVDVVALRAQAHELIDRMTAEELLSLPLNLGMLYRR